MSDKTITPERLAEIERRPQAPSQDEMNELLRGYRSHLAQAETSAALGTCGNCGASISVTVPRDPRENERFSLHRRGVEATERLATATEAIAERDHLRARIAELEAQLANEQRAYKAYREEAQRIDKARGEQLATVTTERDQAWENRNMLRRELDTSRAEVLRLNELGKKEQIDLNVERAKTARLTWELQAERAKVTEARLCIRDARKLVFARGGHFNRIDIELGRAERALQPAAPKEAVPPGLFAAMSVDLRDERCPCGKPASEPDPHNDGDCPNEFCASCYLDEVERLKKEDASRTYHPRGDTSKHFKCQRHGSHVPTANGGECMVIDGGVRCETDCYIEPCNCAPKEAKEVTTVTGSPPRWRTGRTLGRTLYRDNVIVGMVDSVSIAEEVVARMNGEKTTADRDLDRAEKENADGREREQGRRLRDVSGYIASAIREVHGPDVDALIDGLGILVGYLREERRGGR